MLKILAILCLMLTGCAFSGKKDKEPSEPVGPWAELEDRRKVYVDRQGEVEGVSGFIDADKCDSIHWTAMRGVALGRPAELRAAIEENGKVHRRPLSLKECYPDESSSEISREAILYVAIHSVVYEDLDLVERIWDYGKAHNWVMGAGSPSRTFFTPSAQTQLAQAIRSLGGSARASIELVNRDPGLVDFEAFIQVASVLLEAVSNGGRISQESQDRLLEHADREPENVFYAAMAARWGGRDLAGAGNLLLASPKYPKDRLPTSAEYCDEWLAQRDKGTSGWEPCPGEGRKHSAGDWLLALWVLTAKFEG